MTGIMCLDRSVNPSKRVILRRTLWCTLLVWTLISSSSAIACDRCVHQSRAAFFRNPSSLLSGSCGYGSLATSLNGGQMAGAVPSIYKDGAGCGACFQIRCKNKQLCTQQGTKIVVTDLNQNTSSSNNKNNNITRDFVLSESAFRAMAKPGMDADIVKLGTIDVQYKRVPCEYNKNLGIRVEESSHKPEYLAIKFLYQGGQTEIVAVDVAQVDSPNWNFMSRNHGAIWDTSRVPRGALQFRMVVTAGYDGKYYWAKNVLPADWKPGLTYDSGVRITDIAQEPCSPCGASSWNSSSTIN